MPRDNKNIKHPIYIFIITGIWRYAEIYISHFDDNWVDNIITITCCGGGAMILHASILIIAVCDITM